MMNVTGPESGRPRAAREQVSPPLAVGTAMGLAAVLQRGRLETADCFGPCSPALPLAAEPTSDSNQHFVVNQAQAALLRLVRDYSEHCGVPGLLDPQKIQWFRKVQPVAHRLRNVDPAMVKLVAENLAALEERAQRHAEGSLRIHASALRPSAIPHARIRAAAMAVAETISMGRAAPDPTSLNILELREALRLIGSDAPADTAMRSLMLHRFGQFALIDMGRDEGRAASKAMANDLNLVEQYLRNGTNGLLVSGYTQLIVGERGASMVRKPRLRQIDIFEMPDATGATGGTIATKEDATKLASEYMPRAITTGMDPVFIYDPTAKKLFVALNPHGDLDNVWSERKVQLFDIQGGMTGTGIVVARHDTINSGGEIAGWYGKAAVKVGETVEAIVKPSAQADRFVTMVEYGQIEAQAARPWWRLMTVAGVVGAITTLVSQIPFILFGLFGGAAVPGVINTIRYMSQEQRLTPIEDLMGVTVVGTCREC